MHSCFGCADWWSLHAGKWQFPPVSVQGHSQHVFGLNFKAAKKLELISRTICLHLIVLFTQSVSGKLSFGKPLSAAAVWSSPSACYFTAVSVILWIMSQTPMQCDRLVPLRFPNQVSSPPALPCRLLSAFTEGWCSGTELRAKDSGLCWCWTGAKVPRLSAPFCPSMWEGGWEAAKPEPVIILAPRDLTPSITYMSSWEMGRQNGKVAIKVIAMETKTRLENTKNC